MEIVASTFDVLGKIMIAYTAIMVHHRFWKEHKIDEKVFAEMKKEQKIGFVGIIFIVVGYILNLLTKTSRAFRLSFLKRGKEGKNCIKEPEMIK